MSIPAEAIEAAAKAIARTMFPRTPELGVLEIDVEAAQAALSASVPFMVQQERSKTLRDAADDAFKDKSIQGLQRVLVGNWLRAHADRIEAGE